MTQPAVTLSGDGISGDAELIFEHDCTDGGRVSVRLPVSEGGWQVVQREPLTVTPSIRCYLCGTHGRWIDGQWVT